MAGAAPLAADALERSARETLNLRCCLAPGDSAHFLLLLAYA